MRRVGSSPGSVIARRHYWRPLGHTDRSQQSAGVGVPWLLAQERLKKMCGKAVGEREGRGAGEDDDGTIVWTGEYTSPVMGGCSRSKVAAGSLPCAG